MAEDDTALRPTAMQRRNVSTPGPAGLGLASAHPNSLVALGLAAVCTQQHVAPRVAELNVCLLAAWPPAHIQQ